MVPLPRTSAILSSLERRENGLVDVLSGVRALFGDAELDFRRAEFGPGVTVIEVKAFCANVELDFPDDVVVEVDISNFLANTSVERGRNPRRGGPKSPPTVRIVGRAMMSNVEIEGGASSRGR